MTVGIYCYYDDFKHRVAYVGKDSHIDKNRRHKQHYHPSLKKKQKINKVLQNDLENNNINRYTYVVLEKSDNWTNEDLNEKEKYYISLFKPKYNFTEGGDGVGSGENHPFYGEKHPEETRRKISEALSGENHPFYGITGEDHPFWKDYARVIKYGITPNGKQIYALKYNGEILIQSISKEELEEVADRINKLENKDEEIINQIIEEYKSRRENKNKKDYARVVKCGFKNGKQNYALRHNGKTIKESIYKEKLEKLAEEINAKKDKRCLDEKQR